MLSSRPLWISETSPIVRPPCEVQSSAPTHVGCQSQRSKLSGSNGERRWPSVWFPYGYSVEPTPSGRPRNPTKAGQMGILHNCPGLHPGLQVVHWSAQPSQAISSSTMREVTAQGQFGVNIRWRGSRWWRCGHVVEVREP